MKIVGRPADLATVIEEYRVHGVEIDEIWLTDNAVSNDEAATIERACDMLGVGACSISAALNLSLGALRFFANPPWTQNHAPHAGYFGFKRILDVVVAAIHLSCLGAGGVDHRPFDLYRCRRTGDFLATADRLSRPGIRGLQVSHLSDAIRQEWRSDRERGAPVEARKRHPRDAAGRAPPTFQYSARRHVADWSAASFAGRSARRPQPADSSSVPA